MCALNKYYSSEIGLLQGDVRLESCSFHGPRSTAAFSECPVSCIYWLLVHIHFAIVYPKVGFRGFICHEQKGIYDH
jgi:hypothetical protein